MFEELVKAKINSEKSKTRLLNPVSRETIRKSELTPFIKNFIFIETPEITENDYLDELIEKGVKLQFNYTIRPKWTLLNYVYGNLESKSDNEIRHKLRVFTFYKFYPDTVLNYLDEETHLFVAKNKIENLLNETNEVLYNKLTNEISGVKIKNFLINIFKLKYEDESKINLESSVPFSFVKIFLEDKKYDDLLKKFDVVQNLKESTLVTYKDIIKVLTGKYFSTHGKKANQMPGKDDIFEEVITNPATEDVTQKEETEAESSVIKKEKLPKKEINYTKYDIYSDDLIKEQEEKQKEEEEIRKETETEIFSEVHEEDTGNQYEIRRLFSEKELNIIKEKIYGSSKTAMKSSFRTLAATKNWHEAAEHLKSLFNERKVNIYHKKVVTFIDTLQSHFQNKDK